MIKVIVGKKTGHKKRLTKAVSTCDTTCWFLLCLQKDLHVSTGELINLAMFCERMRRRFWPEWFVEVEDFYYDGDSESSSGGTPTGLLDFGLFSRTDTLDDSDGSSHSAGRTHTHSPDSDRSLFDSDVGTGSDNDAQFKEESMPDLEV